MRRRSLFVFVLFLMMLFAVVPLLGRPANAQEYYDVEIWGWDYINGWTPPVAIYKDGEYSGFSTPHTFGNLTGTHTFMVPLTNGAGNYFSDWDVGGNNWTSNELTVSSGGTYTARYRAGYSVTIWGWCAAETQGWIGQPIAIDGGFMAGVNTPYTFYGLTGQHTITVPDTDASGHKFYQWDTGYTSTTFTIINSGVYTARYHSIPKGSINIDAGATYATSATVTLSLTYDSTTSQVRYMNDGGSWTAWESPVSSKSWSLTSGAGDKTVYCQFKDNAGVMSPIYSDTIILDTTVPQGWFEINANLTSHDYTSSTSVLIIWSKTVSGISNVSQARYSNDGTSWTAWESFNVMNPHRSWTLTFVDGTKTVYCQLRSDAGLISSTISDTIILDTTPPEGGITINDDAPYCNSTSVSLTCWASDNRGLGQKRFSNDGTTWTPWDFNFLTSWTLASGEGTKTVYLQVKDLAGNTAVFSDTIVLQSGTATLSAGTGKVRVLPGDKVIIVGDDYTPNSAVTVRFESTTLASLVNITLATPTITTNSQGDFTAEITVPTSITQAQFDTYRIVATDTNAYAASATVYINYHVLANPSTAPAGSTVTIYGRIAANTQYIISIGAETILTGTTDAKGAFSHAYLLPLVTAQGAHTLMIAWNTGNFASSTLTVYGQFVAPTGSILINGDAPQTTSVSVMLSLTYSAYNGSTVSQVRYSNDGNSWTAWETPAASKTWTLTSGDGPKTVYYQIKDNAGLTSTTYTDSITLQSSTDTTPPTGSITINGGVTTTNSASVVLTISATDPESSVTQMRFSNDGSSWSGWEAYTSSKAWTLTPSDGAKTVYVQFKNSAGLESTSYSDSITLQSSSSDTTPPTGSIEINGGAATTNSASVTLTLSATDNSGVVAQMRFANLGESWTAWEPYVITKTWTLTSGTGTKTVLAQFKDGSGIESAPYGDTIQFDPSFEEKTFNVTVGTNVYSVNTRSNSSVSDFSFNQVLKRIRFTTNGTNGTTCFCNATIPAALMSGDFSLFIDDVQLLTNTGYTQTYNGTHYMFSMNHAIGVHAVEIFGTNVIPEFPPTAELSFSVILASALAIGVKRRLERGKVPHTL